MLSVQYKCMQAKFIQSYKGLMQLMWIALPKLGCCTNKLERDLHKVECKCVAIAIPFSGTYLAECLQENGGKPGNQQALWAVENTETSLHAEPLQILE